MHQFDKESEVKLPSDGVTIVRESKFKLVSNDVQCWHEI